MKFTLLTDTEENIGKYLEYPNMVKTSQRMFINAEWDPYVYAEMDLTEVLTTMESNYDYYKLLVQTGTDKTQQVYTQGMFDFSRTFTNDRLEDGTNFPWEKFQVIGLPGIDEEIHHVLKEYDSLEQNVIGLGSFTNNYSPSADHARFEIRNWKPLPVDNSSDFNSLGSLMLKIDWNNLPKNNKFAVKFWMKKDKNIELEFRSFARHVTLTHFGGTVWNYYPVTDMSYMCYGDSQTHLKTIDIPYIFFNKDNVSRSSFLYAFPFCKGLTSKTPTYIDGRELWELEIGTDLNENQVVKCFDGNINMANYSEIPPEWGGPTA